MMKFLKTVSYKANMTTDDLMYILIVQLTESLDVIITEKLLVPTFKNSCDSPDNIFELPYGIDTCLNHYPKFAQAQG